MILSPIAQRRNAVDSIVITNESRPVLRPSPLAHTNIALRRVLAITKCIEILLTLLAQRPEASAGLQNKRTPLQR